MSNTSRSGRRTRRAIAIAVSLVLIVSTTLVALANVPITKIGEDTYTNTTSQHKTQVEPDTFSFGNTIVMTTQTGRFFNGGASNIAWAASQDGGNTWVSGNLPGITRHDNPVNPYDRASDPVVTYNAADGWWLISTLALLETPSVSGVAVLTSRSTDATGTSWLPPVVVTNLGDVDKNWIVCDNTPTSPFYGNCYTQWDVFSDGDRIYMSTSTDGGITWGPRKKPQGNPTGLGGQPVVQPNGTVIVPIDNAFETSLRAFRSTDGGNSWSRIRTITNLTDHTVAGSLRTGPLPSAEVDAAGKVYVVWQDCRFRSGCTANDIVMSTSTNGTSWSAVARIPIDATNSGVDHFIPGIAVDRSTSGGSAHIVVTYYYYPVANCTAATCQLRVGSISSTNGGATWSAPVEVAGPMTLSWLPNTSQGRMVGDYISTSFNAGGTAHGAFAVANAPTAGGPDCATATPNCDQATYTTTGGQALLADQPGVEIAAGLDQPVPNATSDHAPPAGPVSRR